MVVAEEGMDDEGGQRTLKMGSYDGEQRKAPEASGAVVKAESISVRTCIIPVEESCPRSDPVTQATGGSVPLIEAGSVIH